MSYTQTEILKKKKIELMRCNENQPGFNFIELMVVLALIGVLGAFVVPNLFKTRQDTARKEFMQSFESLVQNAVLRSLVEHVMHQICIDIAHQKITMRIFDEKSVEQNKHKQFKDVSDQDYVTEIPFLSRFSIHNFFINGVDEVTPGTAMQDVVFYIMPDGTSQSIVANFVDQDQDNGDVQNRFSCKINPFYARMSVYETFQTP